MDVEELIALILLAVEVLPIVLLLIVNVVPDVACIPTKLCETEVEEPVTFIEPILLFDITTVEDDAALPIPKLIAPVVDEETETEPVPVDAPIVLPVVLPILALPATK